MSLTFIGLVSVQMSAKLDEKAACNPLLFESLQ